MIGRTLLVALDGAICRGDFEVSALPVATGMDMVTAFEQIYRIVFVAPPGVPMEHVEHWLAVHLNLTEIVVVENRPLADVVRLARNRQSNVAAVLTGSPLLAAEALQVGLTPILAVHPEYVRPEFRPDHRGPARPWSDLVAEIDRQKLSKVSDVRLVEADATSAKFEEETS